MRNYKEEEKPTHIKENTEGMKGQWKRWREIDVGPNESKRSQDSKH